MTGLERAFHDALMDATRQCQRLRYNPTYALQMIAESGPVGACKRLLDKPEVSEGFTRLWELRRLDLTVEAIVLRPEFAPLFTDEDRDIARRRLAQVGYTVPEPTPATTTKGPGVQDVASGPVPPADRSSKTPDTGAGGEGGGPPPAAPPQAAPVPPGNQDSSITRVRPFFRCLFAADPTGRAWLSQLLDEAARINNNPIATSYAQKPGQLLSTWLETRAYHDNVWDATIALYSSKQQGKWTGSVQLSRHIPRLHPELAAMTCSVTLDAAQRRALIERYRKDPDPEVRFRAHILLLLDDGYTWTTVATLLFCSSRTIDRWVKRFRGEGIEGLAGHKPGRPFRFAAGWIAVAVAWVTTQTPRAFGFLRSRWCCEAVAVLMLELHQVEVSRETVRRWLHRGNLVYRRPRPVLKPTDSERQAKLDALRQLLAGLPEDETAVFQDEVDINTNPKIGSMWMVKGQQAKVDTPGNNEKRYLSGSIHWRTGQVFLTEGRPKQGRDTALFLAHLDDLRGRLRRYRKIHVICDNAKCHTSDEVAMYLWEHRERIDLHLLPKYSPDCNPIERVWWNLHDQITRNHRCETMEELLDLTFAWLGSRNPFKVEDKVYRAAA